MAGVSLVAVVVVSWNTRALLQRCLESLEPEVRSERAEVWVVDNGSSDGSPEMVRERFPWVRLVASRENLGFGRAVNLVARQTESPWIGIANADVALRARALDLLLAAGAQDTRAGAIAPRLLLPGGATQHSAFAFPSISLALLVSSGLGRLIRPLGARHLLIGRFDSDRPRRVPWAIAAFLLVRREAWDAIGGFDERQWMYAEDLDLGWRLARAGWATRYEPRAEVAHESSASTEQAWGDAGKTERWQRASYAWMMRRIGPRRTRAIAGVLWAGQVARWLAYTPAALVAPGHFRGRREAARWWMNVHRVGFGSREELEAVC